FQCEASHGRAAETNDVRARLLGCAALVRRIEIALLHTCHLCLLARCRAENLTTGTEKARAEPRKTTGAHLATARKPSHFGSNDQPGPAHHPVGRAGCNAGRHDPGQSTRSRYCSDRVDASPSDEE